MLFHANLKLKYKPRPQAMVWLNGYATSKNYKMHFDKSPLRMKVTMIIAHKN